MMKDYYELNTDEFYAYGYQNEDWAVMNFTALLCDGIDFSRMQSALRLAFARFPYFDTVLSSEALPERLVLRRCPSPAVLFRSEGFVPLDSPELQGRLIAASCSEKALRLGISHALTDGVGAKAFIRALLAFYCQLKYEGREEADLRSAPAEGPAEDEYDNPFDYLRLPDFTYQVKPKKTFVFPEEEIDESQKKYIRFSVPQSTLLKFTKARETSVAAVASWLLMRSVFAVTGTNLPVKVAVPFDMRRQLGCLHSNRNCNTTLYLQMAPGFLRRDSETQLTALRGEMFLQMDEGNAVPRMAESREGWLQACKCQTIEERTDFYHGEDNLDFAPIVSYIGTADLGEYEKYCEQQDFYVKVSGQAGMLMGILSSKERFRFNITTTLKHWDQYLNAMLRVMDENDIPYSDVTVEDV